MFCSKLILKLKFKRKIKWLNNVCAFCFCISSVTLYTSINLLVSYYWPHCGRMQRIDILEYSPHKCVKAIAVKSSPKRSREDAITWRQWVTSELSIKSQAFALKLRKRMLRIFIRTSTSDALAIFAGVEIADFIPFNELRKYFAGHLSILFNCFTCLEMSGAYRLRLSNRRVV